jgi:hypothetical protein
MKSCIYATLCDDVLPICKDICLLGTRYFHPSRCSAFCFIKFVSSGIRSTSFQRVTRVKCLVCEMSSLRQRQLRNLDAGADTCI